MNGRKHSCLIRILSLLMVSMLLLPLAGRAEQEQEAGQELLNGLEFGGSLNVQLYKESGGAAVLSIVDGELQVDVQDVGRVEHAIQPYYDGFKLIQGVSYVLSWDVRSSVERYMQVRIQLNGGDYHAYASDRIHTTPEMTHYELSFTMTEDTDPAPRLCVNMGDVPEVEGEGHGVQEPHQVYFDNFSLKVVDSSNAVAEGEDPDAVGIRLNQVGYTVKAVKTAVFAGISTDEDSFRVVKADTGETVFEGTLGPVVDNAWAGETDRVADFSTLAEPGTYAVEAADGTRSPVFALADDVYTELLRAAVRMLTLQRCGTPLEQGIGEDFAHRSEDRCQRRLA